MAVRRCRPEALAAPVAEIAADGRRQRLAKRELGLRRLADRVAG